MGIKHFWKWFSEKYPETIQNITKTEKTIQPSVDNLLIDMNGIFHTSAQKIYQYGNYKPLPSLFNHSKIKRVSKKNDYLVYKDVCEYILSLLKLVNPKKRAILCVDGSAPQGKQNQQRQRRYRNSSPEKNEFNPSSITPGTRWMDQLTRYIDRFLKENLKNFKGLEIFFSNEKCPGEGEHKCLNFIRNNPRIESYCMFGLDADLIMLSLGTHLSRFYLLREDLYNPNNEFFLVDIGAASQNLIHDLTWSSSKYIFKPYWAINDFVFMCFAVGNDFLPHIPSVEIIEGGIDLMFELYKDTCTKMGHLTVEKGPDILFSLPAFCSFLSKLGNYEKTLLEGKWKHRKQFFTDQILESSIDATTGTIDIDQYRHSYYEKYFSEGILVSDICREYLEGLQWVLSYYTRGVPSWNWRYPYHYAPFAYNLSKYIHLFELPNYGPTSPMPPFQQLLAVLPPSCASLLPSPLNQLLTDPQSELKPYYPEQVEIDLAGKRKEWEGIVLVCPMNIPLLKKEYFKYIKKVDLFDLKRNMRGKTLKYWYSLKTNQMKVFPSVWF